MNVLVCSAARFGIANVVYNVIEKMEPLDVEITYCRNPLNPSPKWCETVDLLNKDFYERLSSTIENTVVYRPVHLSYGILWYWRKAFKYIERHGEKYDVVWLHSPHWFIFDRHLGCADNIVVTVHGMPSAYENKNRFEEHYNNYIDDLQSHILSRSEIKAVTGVGPDVVFKLREKNVPEEKIRFVRNGVSIEKYSPTNQSNNLYSDFGIPNDHTIFLFLGRFSEMKQPIQLLKTFRRLDEISEKISLLMVGEGELHQSTKEFVYENNIQNIYLPGYVSEEMKVQLYASSDFFVLPSLYEAGYPPLVLAEALASGTACIVHEGVNASDFIADGDCGLITNFNNPDQAALDIQKYIDTYENGHGGNARRFAESNLSWRSVSKSYCELLIETTTKDYRMKS